MSACVIPIRYNTSRGAKWCVGFHAIKHGTASAHTLTLLRQGGSILRSLDLRPSHFYLDRRVAHGMVVFEVHRRNVGVFVHLRENRPSDGKLPKHNRSNKTVTATRREGKGGGEALGGRRDRQVRQPTDERHVAKAQRNNNDDNAKAAMSQAPAYVEPCIFAAYVLCGHNIRNFKGRQ